MRDLSASLYNIGFSVNFSMTKGHLHSVLLYFKAQACEPVPVPFCCSHQQSVKLQFASLLLQMYLGSSQFLDSLTLTLQRALLA
jgi:hypothetical protein